MEETRKLKNFIRSSGLKQVLFITAATILSVTLIWFVIYNFIFLVNNLNRAFDNGVKPSEPTVQFDKAGFEELNLVK